MTVPAKASRIWITQLAVGATLGAIAGAVLGGVVFGALGTDSTATSLVRLTPPVELVAIAAGAERTTPDAESYVTQYVAGEVAYLSGVGFTRAVGDSLGRSEPAQIDVLEEIGSSVVVFSASADSDADAVRTVQAAIDVYSDQLEERSEQQLQTILPALDTWQQAANAAGDASRVRQIQTLRESIGLQAGAPAAITVLQQPAVDGASGRQWPLGMVLGALLGGTAVPLRQLARSRKAGRLTSATEIADLVDSMFVPAVDLGQAAAMSRSKKAVTVARTLYGQCPSPGPARTIVLIGASPSSGTSIVSSLLERGAGEVGPVKVIRLADDSTTGFHPVDETGTLIVDAGAIGDSWLIGEAVQQATDLIVVARLGTDTVEQVFAVRSATTASAAPLFAVMAFGRGFSRSSHR